MCSQHNCVYYREQGLCARRWACTTLSDEARVERRSPRRRQNTLCEGRAMCDGFNRTAECLLLQQNGMREAQAGRVVNRVRSEDRLKTGHARLHGSPAADSTLFSPAHLTSNRVTGIEPNSAILDEIADRTNFSILCIGPYPAKAVHWLRLISAGLAGSASETVSRRKDTLAGETLAAKACGEADHEHLTLGPAEARTASSWPRAAAMPQSRNLTSSPAGETERCTLCTCCCRAAAMAEGCLVHDVFWCMSSKPIVTCVVPLCFC